MVTRENPSQAAFSKAERAGIPADYANMMPCLRGTNGIVTRDSKESWESEDESYPTLTANAANENRSASSLLCCVQGTGFRSIHNLLHDQHFTPHPQPKPVLLKPLRSSRFFLIGCEKVLGIEGYRNYHHLWLILQSACSIVCWPWPRASLSRR